jgi:hypothetical protein
MKNRTFFAWHLGYLTIIAALVGCSIHRHDREKNLRNFLHLTLIQARHNAADSRSGLYDQIQNTIGAFSSPTNLQIRQQVQEADSLRRQFQTLVNSCIEVSDVPGLRNMERPIVAPLSAEKIRHLQEAADSIQKKYKALVDTQIIGTGLMKYTPCHFPNWLAGYLKTANVEEMTAVLSSIYLQADLAENVVLNHLASTMSDGSDFMTFEPVLNATNSTPRMGDWYEASVFLAHRFAPEGLKIKVNGQELPVEDGAAHISRQFDKPGINTFRVEIDLISPLDNTTKTYTRNYQVEVLPLGPSATGTR